MVVAAVAARPSDRPSECWSITNSRDSQFGGVILSKAVFIVLSLTLVLNTGVPLFAKMIVYYATYSVHDPQRGQTMLSAMVVGQLAGLIPWIMIVRRMTPQNSLILSCVAIVAVATLMFVAGSRSAMVDAAIGCGFGAAACGIYTLIWVLVAESAEAFEVETGTARPVFIFALAIVAIKLGQGIGAVISGQALALAGYLPHGPIRPEAVATISGLQCGGPIVAGLIGIVLLILYRCATVDNASQRSVR